MLSFFIVIPAHPLPLEYTHYIILQILCQFSKTLYSSYDSFAYTATDGKKYNVDHYNLYVIISVGYRVKSQRGTQFRVWANKVLKEYLIKGYAVNQQVKIEQLEDLKNTVHLLSNVIEHKQLTLDEANGLLRVITDYTYGLDTLDKYDFQQLEVVSTTPSREFRATYEEAMGAIHLLQEKFGSSDLFGNEKDQSFKSSINTHCFSCSGAASLTLIEAIFFLSFPYFTLSSTSGLP